MAQWMRRNEHTILKRLRRREHTGKSVLIPGPAALWLRVDGPAVFPSGLVQLPVNENEDENENENAPDDFDENDPDMTIRWYGHVVALGRRSGSSRCYVTPPLRYLPCNINLIIEMLQRTLNWVGGPELAFLPSRLYLEVTDCPLGGGPRSGERCAWTCWRQNKNSYLINWLGSLIDSGLFPNGIHLSFRQHNVHAVQASRVTTRSQSYRNACVQISPDHVEILENIVNTTSLLNPERLPAWDNSRWKPIPSLHLHESEGFLLRKNESGYVTLRWQGEVADDADWSEPLQIEKFNIM
jgi:hypothetical protein